MKFWLSASYGTMLLHYFEFEPVGSEVDLIFSSRALAAPLFNEAESFMPFG